MQIMADVYLLYWVYRMCENGIDCSRSDVENKKKKTIIFLTYDYRILNIAKAHRRRVVRFN